MAAVAPTRTFAKPNPNLAAAHIKPAHPFTPLAAWEIARTAELVQSVWPEKTDLRFKVISLHEPPKSTMVPYLEALHNGTTPLPFITRKAFISYYIRNTSRFHEAVVNLDAGSVESNVRLGPNLHGNADYDEILHVETTALNDPLIKTEIAKLQLPEGSVICADPWVYGSDGVNDDERQYQVFLYMRDPNNSTEADSNQYAFPLPISPVVECNHFTIVRIDYLPTGAGPKPREPGPWQFAPPNEYIPEAQVLRQDLKPLHVVQPEGPSFSLSSIGETGHVINWQKWSFIIGFNQREGMILYDVRYDSRPLFYRVSLSDMSIPYADPRHPYHKKQAFDLGDGGAGAMANNLSLGCDCLGHIQYLHGIVTDDKGVPTPVENAVCVHEQDAGILWKHTNYRTGRAALSRSRELVLQSIITVGNYEYILAFVFNQAAELMYEVRATGILSTQPIDQELNKVGVPFGTVVHPGVLAAHHQHIFSLRVDPMIDGHENRLVYEEAHAMPINEEWNPHGIGYQTKETVINKASGHDLNVDGNRVFKVQNVNIRNPINNKPVAYKIHAPPFQKLLAHPSSFAHKRAEFADHNVYVTTHRDDELYAGGWYTNQSRGGKGLRSWTAREDDVKDKDIVIWVSFGMNHVPRIEDFPVMPSEILKVSLKPVNFFGLNPGLDVTPSEQKFNKSTLVTQQHQPALHSKTGGNCCGSKTKL